MLSRYVKTCPREKRGLVPITKLLFIELQHLYAYQCIHPLSAHATALCTFNVLQPSCNRPPLAKAKKAKTEAILDQTSTRRAAVSITATLEFAPSALRNKHSAETRMHHKITLTTINKV